MNGRWTMSGKGASEDVRHPLKSMGCKRENGAFQHLRTYLPRVWCGGGVLRRVFGLCWAPILQIFFAISAWGVGGRPLHHDDRDAIVE